MTRFKAVALGTLAMALAAAPMAPAFAGGYGSHHHGKRHHYYGNPLYPVVGLAAAVVGAAAAVVTLPFALIGAAAAHAPRHYAPAPAPQDYYAPQANASPAYAAPRAYYPPPPRAYYRPPAASHSYAPPAPYHAPGLGQYSDFDGYRAPPGYAANGGYYRQDGGPSGGYYAPPPRPHGLPNAAYAPPNQH